IQLGRNDIQAAQDRHDVADLMPHDQRGKDGKVNKRRRPSTGTIRSAAAIGYDIESQLSVWRFGSRVDFFFRRLPLPIGHDQLEVVNQPFNAAVSRRLVWKYGLIIGSNVDRSRRQILNSLTYDLEALGHFFHAHKEAGITIAFLSADDFEIKIFVSE